MKSSLVAYAVAAASMGLASATHAESNAGQLLGHRQAHAGQGWSGGPAGPVHAPSHGNRQVQHDSRSYQYGRDHRDHRDHRDIGGRGNYGYQARGSHHPGYARTSEYRRGGYVSHEYRSRQYVVNDWHARRLEAPRRNQQWLQVGAADYALVAIASGIILQLVLNQ